MPTHLAPPPVVTQEITIVDRDGHPRLLLCAKSGIPKIEMLQSNGRSSFEVALDPAGRPAMKLSNPDAGGPTATLEVVETGTHVKFVRQTRTKIPCGIDGVSGGRNESPGEFTQQCAAHHAHPTLL